MQNSKAMANFDPKTTIGRLLLQYPSLRRIFAEAAPIADDGISVEEFCFGNNIDIVDFLKSLNAEIDLLKQQEASAREAYEQRIAADKDAIGEKTGKQSGNKPSPEAGKRQHDPAMIAILAISSLIFLATAAANFFTDLSWLRSVFSINPAVGMPHIAQMLGLLNLTALAGCVMLYFWKRLGIIVFFAAAMFNDILAVALTGSLPYETLIALVVFYYLTRRKIDGKPYFHQMD